MAKHNFPYVKKMIVHLINKHGPLHIKKLHDRVFTWASDINFFVLCINQLHHEGVIDQNKEGVIHLVGQAPFEFITDKEVQ